MVFVSKQVAVNQARRESRKNGFVWTVGKSLSTNLFHVGMRHAQAVIVIARFQSGRNFK